MRNRFQITYAKLHLKAEGALAVILLVALIAITLAVGFASNAIMGTTQGLTVHAMFLSVNIQ